MFAGGDSRLCLVFSPASVKNPQKRRRTGSDSEKQVHEARGMEYVSAERNVDVDDLGIDIGSIHTTILTRVNQVLKEIGSKSGPSGSGDGDSGGDSSSSAAFVQQVIPAIVTSVAVAVGEVLKKVLGRFSEGFSCRSDQVQKLQRNTLLMKYENDRLEQYTRRESIRIIGLKEEREEKLEEKVLSIFKDEGVDVSPGDIAAVHRAGWKGKHVLVRFVSRKKRREVMMNKKKLKGKEGYKDIFLNDDLTHLRAKLLKYVKDSGKFGPVWTVEGKIYCGKKRPLGAPVDTSEKPKVVENPDDLFKIGFDTVDFNLLGLADLIVEDQ